MKNTSSQLLFKYDYPSFHLSMDCFWCELVSGDLVLREHQAAKWLRAENIDEVKWLPADKGILKKIAEEM